VTAKYIEPTSLYSLNPNQYRVQYALEILVETPVWYIDNNPLIHTIQVYHIFWPRYKTFHLNEIQQRQVHIASVLALQTPKP
jgi:hypothetical protein